MDIFAHNREPRREHVAKHAYTVMHTVHVLAHYAVCVRIILGLHRFQILPLQVPNIAEVFTSTSINTWNHYKYFIIIQ